MLPFCAACSDPRYSTIVFCCGSQMGKTENVLNIVGHRLADGPYMPVLLVFPTEKLSRSMSNDRFSKMVDATQALHSRLVQGHSNKVMEKFFGGIRCGFAYAGSATELSSHPAGLVVIDEIDRMSDVSGEGDPYLLAKARTKNYVGSKVVITSTPTLEGGSRIWSLWESGTRGRWAWPCRHCQEYFVPEFALLKWEGETDPDLAAKTAYLVCPHCGGDMHTKHRHAANQAGRYEYCRITKSGELVNTGPEPPDSPTASFWASGLASPWQSFGDIAYIVATALNSRDQGTIQGAVNTYLGETYRLTGDAPQWERVKTHRLDYSEDMLPDGVQRICMGVDVQKNRLFYVIRGYGYKGESWRLRAGEIWGETEFDPVWLDLGALVGQKIGNRPINRVFVDSGYTPGRTTYVRPDNKIYLFCRLSAGQCFPSKGKDSADRPIKASKIDMTVAGRVIKGGLTLWHIDTDFFKRQLYSNIRREPDQPHGWHVPSQVTDDYCKQVTAEECITTEQGKRRWIQTREDNHFLDCEVLCDAAAYSIGVHNLPDPGAPTERQEEQKKPGFVPRPKGSFFGR
jgi:phage terminase large subunit GpA-like protein